MINNSIKMIYLFINIYIRAGLRVKIDDFEWKDDGKYSWIHSIKNVNITTTIIISWDLWKIFWF